MLRIKVKNYNKVITLNDMIVTKDFGEYTLEEHASMVFVVSKVQY